LHSNAGSVSGTKAVLDSDIAALYPSQLLKPLPQCLNAALRFRIALSNRQQHSYTAPAFGLLRARCDRPYRRRAAEQRDELAPSYVEHGGFLAQSIRRTLSLPQNGGRVAAVHCPSRADVRIGSDRSLR